MACKQWRDAWVARLYGELDENEQAAVDAHLALCAECSETMRELGHARRLLGESAPTVPAAPRVVVLRPRPVWGNAWAFATGVAAATLVFFVGTLAATRHAGGSDGPVATTGEFAAAVRALDGRLTALEESPTPISADLAAQRDVVTREELEREIDRVSRRFRRERAEDLDYLARWLAAAEQRTGTFIDRTEEALTYLALRGDPHVSER